MKKRLGKFGLIFLALALCLSITGAGFAAWTDKLTIEGTVNTGSVGGSIEWVSGTWVYKVVGAPDDIVVQHERGSLKYRPAAPAGGELIAYGEVLFWAENLQTKAETVTVKFDNLFPCVDFCVDILWHYDGTVPAKVNSIDFTWSGDPLLEDIWHGAIGVRCDENGNVIDAAGGIIGGEHPWDDPAAQIVDVGTQLHYCDYVLILISLHVPQDNAYMGLEGTGTIGINLVQWNEYPYTG